MLEPTEKAKGLFDWLAPELRRFYQRTGRRMTEYQLRLEIERRWGDKIVQKVCIPRGMSSFQCLTLAAMAAREPSA